MGLKTGGLALVFGPPTQERTNVLPPPARPSFSAVGLLKPGINQSPVGTKLFFGKFYFNGISVRFSTRGEKKHKNLLEKYMSKTCYAKVERKKSIFLFPVVFPFDLF
jgi:hypothetical protein